MLLLGIMTGIIVGLMLAKVTRWFELLLLGGWGLMAAGTSIGAPVVRLFSEANSFLVGWFS